MPFTSTLFGALSGLGVRVWANVMYKKRLLFSEFYYYVMLCYVVNFNFVSSSVFLLWVVFSFYLTCLFYHRRTVECGGLHCGGRLHGVELVTVGRQGIRHR